MPSKPSTIILSYRRADAQGVTGRIFDRLAQHYGAANVFMDIDSIPVGVDFHDHLKSVLASCEVLIVVIGPRYLGPRRGKLSRIMDENDWVRLELETALELGVAVVPVLVQGAGLPSVQQLPPSLHPLLRRNTMELDSGRDFHVHLDRLIAGVDSLLSRRPGEDAAQESSAASPSAPAPAAQDAKPGASYTQVRKIAALGVVLAGLVLLAIFVGSFLSDRRTSGTEAAALTPGENCDLWRRNMAGSWEEYQNHQGRGYSVIAQKGFATASDAQEAVAALRRKVLGRPQFFVARHVERDEFVIGFGFNIPERRAQELADGLANCYDVAVAVMDPSVELVSPMGTVKK